VADRCRTERPELLDLGHGQHSACHFHDKLAGRANTAALFPAGEPA
jgi:hypothetical protein